MSKEIDVQVLFTSEWNYPNSDLAVEKQPFETYAADAEKRRNEAEPVKFALISFLCEFAIEFNYTFNSISSEAPCIRASKAAICIMIHSQPTVIAGNSVSAFPKVIA